MVELSNKDFALAIPLLDDLQVGADIAGAVLSGHTNGKVFVDTPEKPQIALIYDNGFCVLAGAASSAEFANTCLNWLRREEGQNFFILYPGHDCWRPVLDEAIAAPIRKLQRVAWQLDRNAFTSKRSCHRLPPEFTLEPMNAALMKMVANTMYPWAGDTWKSTEQFETDGIGFCIFAEGKIVSLCYSVFVCGAHHEIDILTSEGFKRRGLGEVVAVAFIEKCLELGLQPGWDCFKDNHASYDLAQILGFIPKNEFPVYSWERSVA